MGTVTKGTLASLGRRGSETFHLGPCPGKAEAVGRDFVHDDAVACATELAELILTAALSSPHDPSSIIHFHVISRRLYVELTRRNWQQGTVRRKPNLSRLDEGATILEAMGKRSGGNTGSWLDVCDRLHSAVATHGAALAEACSSIVRAG